MQVDDIFGVGLFNELQNISFYVNVNVEDVRGLKCKGYNNSSKEKHQGVQHGSYK